ncbi:MULTISPECIES: type II secretion system minor pseudopilin GspH [Gammaproteobacteria]|uniref:type II secretion system minor pseudopilin GspH n=1 Tax=Gammaproteobacteria TaxID=1236 RepID=UPI000DD08FF9|nr:MULTISPECIES: type II secretion system minor pseudopilin GspH [Gammaproteobacteria]RTE86201.1 type II secretion system protein GspH [Aliidiomarina sp. B3213]TCZ91553.1 type II secretion system protein GspH [Lysobacter sp. N42]
MFVPRRSQLGFTLVEVMVVAAIVGLMAWVIVLQLPERSSEQTPDEVAEEFAQQFRHVREQALLRQWVAGIEFKNDGYRFVLWNEQGWQVINQAPITPKDLSEHYQIVFIPGDFELLQNEDAMDSLTFSSIDEDDEDREEDEERKITPQVIIFESSEFVPFRVQFRPITDPDATVSFDGRSGVELNQVENAIW